MLLPGARRDLVAERELGEPDQGEPKHGRAVVVESADQGVGGLDAAGPRGGRERSSTQNSIAHERTELLPWDDHAEPVQPLERREAHVHVARRERTDEDARRGVHRQASELADSLDGGRAHVRVAVAEQALERRHRGRIVGPSKNFGRQLFAVRIEGREGGDDRWHRASPERRERFDDGIAQADVLAGIERAHQLIEQRIALSEKKCDLAGFLAHPPIRVAEGPEHEVGRIPLWQIGNEGDRSSSHFGIDRIERALDLDGTHVLSSLVPSGGGMRLR